MKEEDSHNVKKSIHEDETKKEPGKQDTKKNMSLKDKVLEKQTGIKRENKKPTGIDPFVVSEVTEIEPDVDITEVMHLAKKNVISHQKPQDKAALTSPKKTSNDKPAVMKNKLQEFDGKPKEKKAGKAKVNKSTIILTSLCIISLLFATDIVSYAKMKSFFKSLTGSNKVMISDVKNSTVPVIGVSTSDSISTGKLSTKNENEQARLNQIAEDSRVYCIISSSPYFENVESRGSLFISNPAESAFYTQVVIKAKDTERELYVSPVLAPDEKIEYDYLSNRSLIPGEYQANAYFNYYSKTGDSGTQDDYMYIGTMVAEILVVLGN